MSERNHLIDLARVLSVLIVVVFHTLLWTVGIGEDGVTVVPWAPGPAWWAISWVATIVPIFFVAAGYANAVVVDTWRATARPYSVFLTLRGSRLLGPLSVAMIMFTTVGTLAAWAGWTAQAVTLSRQFAQLFWFAVVYQLLLAAAPLAVWLQDRWGGWVMVPLLAGAIAVDVAVRITGDLGLQWVALAFVWPLAHQLGIAYHRGWFRAWPAPAVLALLAGCAGVIAILVFGLDYPPSAVAWADVLVANLLPPTLAILVLGVAQTCVLALLEQAGLARRLSPTASGFIRVANALLLTVYLWQIPAIVVGAAILVGLAWDWPTAAPILLSQGVLVVLVLVLVVVSVPWIARLDLRFVPRPGPGIPHPGWAEAGYALFAAGTFAVWQCGAVLHLASPASIAAVLTYATGALVLRRATHSTQDSA